MAPKSKDPPEFLEGRSYKSWKNKVTMWMRSQGSRVEKKDQALMVRLHSFGNHPLAEKTVESLTVDDLNIVTGMVVLFAKLDKVFLAEKVDEVYDAFLKFFCSYEGEERYYVSIHY